MWVLGSGGSRKGFEQEKQCVEAHRVGARTGRLEKKGFEQKQVIKCVEAHRVGARTGRLDKKDLSKKNGPTPSAFVFASAG